MYCVSTFFRNFYVDGRIVIGGVFFKSYGIKHIAVYTIFLMPFSWLNPRITKPQYQVPPSNGIPVE